MCLTHEVSDIIFQMNEVVRSNQTCLALVSLVPIMKYFEQFSLHTWSYHPMQSSTLSCIPLSQSMACSQFARAEIPIPWILSKTKTKLEEQYSRKHMGTNTKPKKKPKVHTYHILLLIQKPDSRCPGIDNSRQQTINPLITLFFLPILGAQFTKLTTLRIFYSTIPLSISSHA